MVIGRRLADQLTLRAGDTQYWFGDALALFAGLAAFGPNPNVADMLIAYTTGYIAVALPLPAGGAGGIDAAMVGALVLADIREVEGGCLSDYPLIARHLAERYREAGTIDVDEEPRLRVFVDARRTPSRVDGRFGLPCFQ